MSDKESQAAAEVSAIHELHHVRKELQRLNRHRYIRMHNSAPRLIWFNLLRGMAFGLGSVLGASVILSLFAWSVSQIEFLPIIGDWASEVLRQIEGTRENAPAEAAR